MGFSENEAPYFGILTIGFLLFRVPYLGPLLSETPILVFISVLALILSI